MIPVVRAQGKVIKRVNKTKSLGLVIDEFLTWNKHKEYITKKIKQNLGMMKKIKGSVPKDSLVMLYKTLVEPYLRYCNIIWEQCENTLIEKVQRLQNRAARIISGTSLEETNHDDLLRELNWMNVKQLTSHDLAVAMFTSNRRYVDPEEKSPDLFIKSKSSFALLIGSLVICMKIQTNGLDATKGVNHVIMSDFAFVSILTV